MKRNLLLICSAGLIFIAISSCNRKNTSLYPNIEGLTEFWAPVDTQFTAPIIHDGDNLGESIHFNFGDSILEYRGRKYYHFSIYLKERHFSINDVYLRLENDQVFILSAYSYPGIFGERFHCTPDTLIDYRTGSNSNNWGNTFNNIGWRSKVTSAKTDNEFTWYLSDANSGSPWSCTITFNKTKGIVNITAPAYNTNAIYL